MFDCQYCKIDHEVWEECDPDSYDGAPAEQWEVTTPPDVYFTDYYYARGSA